MWPTTAPASRLTRRTAASRPNGGPLLFVGDGEPRKNLDGLLAAYAAYRADADDPAPLVLAGPGAAVADGQPGVQARPVLTPAASSTICTAGPAHWCTPPCTRDSA